MTHFTAADVPDQTGKCIIVTGANTGLGFEITKALAAKNARVLLACRNEGKASAAIDKIKQATPTANLSFLPFDQADIESIRRAADLASQEPRIDVLLNNAGVMVPPLTRTAQGFELQFGVNHLGCFALTSLMLPKLAQTSGSRVVVTASIAHKTGKLNWDDLNSHQKYGRSQRYSDSKLANLLFMIELDRRLRASGLPVSAMGCHPGVASTDLMRHLGPLQFAMPLMGMVLNTAEMGAWPALQAATDPSAQSGDYFGSQGWREMRGASGSAHKSNMAQNAELARRLWDVSVALTGIDPHLPPT